MAEAASSSPVSMTTRTRRVSSGSGVFRLGNNNSTSASSPVSTRARTVSHGSGVIRLGNNSSVHRHSSNTSSAGRKQDVQYTEVVVIGNGPSGICLSYLLSGHWPYYNGHPHTDNYLQMRLQDEGPDKSIVQQDLEYLSSGLEGRSNSPVSLLFDSLSQPGADLGVETDSVLTWKQEAEERVIPHVVLGRYRAGGAWQMMEGSTHTLSLGNWMQLPDQPFKEWLAKHRNRNDSDSGIEEEDDGSPPSASASASSAPQTTMPRANMEDVRRYYEEYVKQKGLGRWMHERHTVTSVERILDVSHAVDRESGEQAPCSHSHEGKFKWEVRGYSTETDECGEQYFKDFCYRAPNVVLATGSYDLPNQLRAPGEHLPYIMHSMAQLEHAIKRKELGPGKDPLLIVGAGLSAADAILLGQSCNIPMIHVFRRDVEDPNIVIRKLPAKLYPEYHKVHTMMREERNEDEDYCSYPQHCVREFKEDGKVLISHTSGGADTVLQVAKVLVLIGSRPDLSFLPDDGKNLGVVPGMHIDSKHNPVDVDPFSYQCFRTPGLYAMGPLAGDTFVRFLRGGALAITSHLVNKRQGKL